MGTRTIVISAAAGFKRDYEARIFVPDPVGREPETSYNVRVERYLNQKYGVGLWRDPDSTTASRSMLHSLELAEHAQPRDGQLSRLRRRAEKSLIKLDKLAKRK